MEIVSTGSTAAAIAEAGVPVTPVEDVTGFPECLDGRVKTLHPAVHAGLLADLRPAQHEPSSPSWALSRSTCWCPTCTRSRRRSPPARSPRECVEQIDIGGPAMVRAAAKNHRHVAVITDPAQYPDVAGAVAAGGFTLEQRAAAGRAGLRAHRSL